MKKIIPILFIIVFIMIISKQDYVIIPKDSIRLRIIPNSNNVEDIMIKEKVTKEVVRLFDGTKEIENKIPDIEQVVKKVFKENNYKSNYNINYGINHFPRKVYNEVIYNEGDYESLVITLGEGKGSNFWCVLFPPLCSLENNTNTKDVTYKLKVSEIINKLMNKK